MDSRFMKNAIALAKKAAALGEIPVGAVIVKNGKIIAEGYNMREAKGNALSHAEIEAINNACKALGDWRLDGCTLYVTLEPCIMCAGAIINARIKEVVFGAYDLSLGCIDSHTNIGDLPNGKDIAIFGGICEDECKKIIDEFFDNLRKMKNEIIKILEKNGIKNVGFCDFSAVSDRLLDCRAGQRLPNDAKTVIICAFPYKVKAQPPQLLSRYAAVPDYHNICGNMLNAAREQLLQKYPQNSFECFCDNSPIPEVFAAAVAGLGVAGDNGLLITKKHGSFVFLGEIVTDLYIESKNLYAECEHCGVCKAVCPVALDKQSCLSNISQKKKLTDCELQILKQNNILWGCDICGEVCPHNKTAENTDISEFINGYRDGYCVDEDFTNRPYAWRGEEPIKRNFENFKK